MVPRIFNAKDRDHCWDVRDLCLRLEEVVYQMSVRQYQSSFLDAVMIYSSGIEDREGLDCLIQACVRRAGQRNPISTPSSPVGLYEAIPHLLMRRSSNELISFHDRLTGENLVGFYGLVWLVTVLEAFLSGHADKVAQLITMADQVCRNTAPVIEFLIQSDLIKADTTMVIAADLASRKSIDPAASVL